MRQLWNRDKPMIPQLSFQRLVRDICNDVSRTGPLRWQSGALAALQDATEAYLTRMFECE